MGRLGTGTPPFLAVSKPYQNPIETAIGVVRRAKSRFPRLLERLRKRETEWTVWKGTSRAQGRRPMHTRGTQNCSADIGSLSGWQSNSLISESVASLPIPVANNVWNLFAASVPFWPARHPAGPRLSPDQSSFFQSPTPQLSGVAHYAVGVPRCAGERGCRFAEESKFSLFPNTFWLGRLTP
jgi:hypothetical protein